MSDSTTLTPVSDAVKNGFQGKVKSYRPRIDILETEAAYHWVADVAGASEEQVEISIEKGILTLSAKVAPPVLEGFDPAWSGYAVGDWTRNVRLGDGIDRENIEATLRDGVLRITLPKSKASLRTTVPVKRAE